MSIASRLAARSLQLRPATTYRVSVRDLVIPTPGRDDDLRATRYVPHGHRTVPLVVTTRSRSRDNLTIRLVSERGYQVLVIDDADGPVHARDQDLVAWLRRQHWYPGVITELSPRTILGHLRVG